MVAASTALLLSCKRDVPPSPPEAETPVERPAAATEPEPPVDPAIESRPYALHVPASYDPSRPVPLVLLLHGYGSSGEEHARYFGMKALADRETFLLAHPDGTLDREGMRFWNATDACCDHDRTGVDDVAWLTALIDDVKQRYRVDPARVFVIGHSNGGFMAHRLACEIPERIAGIVSVAGATWLDSDVCTGEGAVAVLQVHGDADPWIPYAGGRPRKDPRRARIPGAKETVARWAARNGCAPEATPVDGRHDFDDAVPGTETRIERHLGCDAGAAELWTLEKGGHVPGFNASWAEAIYRFLMAHPKSQETR